MSHCAHDDRKIARPLQHPGSVTVATAIQDQFFRTPGLKPRLPKFLCPQSLGVPQQRRPEYPAFVALAAASFQSF
jgi:hypothetical protein